MSVKEMQMQKRKNRLQSHLFPFLWLNFLNFSSSEIKRHRRKHAFITTISLIRAHTTKQQKYEIQQPPCWKNWLNVIFLRLFLHFGKKTGIQPETAALPATPCLLYTSPSPRDKRQSRMPSSA